MTESNLIVHINKEISSGSQDIGQNVHKYAGLVWLSDFWHNLLNISGPDDYFWIMTFALTLGAQVSNTMNLINGMDLFTNPREGIYRTHSIFIGSLFIRGWNSGSFCQPSCRKLSYLAEIIWKNPALLLQNEIIWQNSRSFVANWNYFVKLLHFQEWFSRILRVVWASFSH